MSDKEQLYEQIKKLRTTEQFLNSKGRRRFDRGYLEILTEHKVTAMARIGELNRKIYAKR